LSCGWQRTALTQPLAPNHPSLQELHDESGSEAPVLLGKDTTERALMARLSDPPASYPLWPVHYLLGCYARATDEARAASQLKDTADQQRLLATLSLARSLAVSYTGFTLLHDMFPVPPASSVRGALQLVDSMFVAAAASGLGSGLAPAPGAEPFIPGTVTSATQVVPMPPGFLEDFVVRFEEDGMSAMAYTLGERRWTDLPLRKACTVQIVLEVINRLLQF